MSDVRVNVSVDLDDLFYDIPVNDYEAGLDLIKAIDIRFADYNFTKKCQEYFNAEIEREDQFISDDEI